MSATDWRRHPLAPMLAVALGWLVSRLIFRVLLGVDFDASSLPWFWQYIDPPLLRDDPGWSLFYFHAQPPLWNLYLAGALCVGGDDPTWILSSLQLAMGLALHVMLFILMTRLGVRTAWAVGAVLLFAFSPASILYESWLFYTYPMAVLLVAAALALHRMVARGNRIPDALLFFGLLAVAVLTRSLIHGIFMLAVVATVVGFQRAHARKLLVAASVPLLLCLAVPAKNAVIVGSFSTSSWLGMNLARLVIEPIPEPERVALYQQGRISAVSVVTPFSSLDRYPAAVRRLSPIDHPVLRRHAKQSGVVNYNHFAYVEISRRYLADALSLVAESPGRYLKSVGRAWLLFAWSPSEYWFLDTNRRHLAGWERVFDALVYGVPAAFGGTREPPERMQTRSLFLHAGWLFILLAPVAVASCAVSSIRELRREDGDAARGLCLLFMVGTVLFVAIAGNALEMRENNRFRFMIEPLILTMGVDALGRGLARLRPGFASQRIVQSR